MTHIPRSPRVVIDTELVLSALIFPLGRLTPLRQAWQGAHCQPLLSPITAAELLRVLAYPKFELAACAQRELLADYLPYCTTVRMPSKLPSTPTCRDPLDVPFMQLALAAKADYLVSGDHDLLSLLNQFACPIMTADQFIKMLSTESCRTGVDQ